MVFFLLLVLSTTAIRGIGYDFGMFWNASEEFNIKWIAHHYCLVPPKICFLIEEIFKNTAYQYCACIHNQFAPSAYLTHPDAFALRSGGNWNSFNIWKHKTLGCPTSVGYPKLFLLMEVWGMSDEVSHKNWREILKIHCAPHTSIIQRKSRKNTTEKCEITILTYSIALKQLFKDI